MNFYFLLISVIFAFTSNLVFSQTVSISGTPSNSLRGSVSLPGYYGLNSNNYPPTSITDSAGNTYGLWFSSSSSVYSNSTVYLYATSTSGYYFAGWSGDSNSTVNPLSITTATDFNVTANFTPNPIPLTVGVSPTNSGVIYQPYYASNPGGATAYSFVNSAGQTYSLYYSLNPNVAVGATVYIQAFPSTGYSFSGWSGDVNGTTNPIAVTAASDLNVTANFELLRYSVSAEIIGDGNVTGTGTYNYGSQFTLEAKSSTTNTFLGWDTNNTTNSNWSAAINGNYLTESNQLSATIYKNTYYKAYFSENVYPTDANLTASIKSYLSTYPYALSFSGVPIKNNPSQLTKAHLEALYSFQSNGLKVENLEGIQHLKNLQSLTVNKNAISDLSPISGLTSLSTLNLNHGASIKSLDSISTLPYLQYLYLEGHRISSISPLTNLAYLYQVNLKKNFIDLSSVDVQTELYNLRFRNVLVEVQQQIPVPIQDLSAGLVAAKEKLALNPLDNESNFIYALEIILNLLEDNSSRSLKALALSLGATEDISSFSLPDLWLEDLDFGNTLNPTFNFSEIQTYLKGTFLITLEVAAFHLSQIPDSTSYLTLTQDFTGLEQVLYADIGDIYLLKSIIKGLTGFAQIILSYDWPMTALTAEQMHDSGLANLESLFDSSNQFGKLKDKRLLLASRKNIKEAITLYKSASAYLLYRIAEKRFFNLASKDLTLEEKFRADLDNILISMDHRLDLNDSNNEKTDVLHLKNFFLGKVDLSQAIPSTVGNKFESSIVPDPTFGGVVPFWTSDTLFAQLQQADLLASDAIEGITELKGSKDWKQSNWLGYFYIPTRTDTSKFWMYHLRLGWVYFSSTSPSSIWLYHQSTSSWLWTKKSSFPYLFNNEEQTWYYLMNSGKLIKWKGTEWES